MRVLCAISRRAGPDLIRRALAMVGTEPELLLLRVIDTDPRRDLEQLPGSLSHGARLGPRRSQSLEDAESAAGEAALSEALATAQAAGATASTRLEWGKPGETIVAIAAQEHASLLVIRAREGTAGRPSFGPASVGHTARFVLDHAPCDVLLIRDPV